MTELRGGVNHFHPAGFFASAGAGYVWHEFKEGSRSGKDDFPILDAAVGFRLTDDRGVLSLEIQNALREEVQFEDRPLASVNNPPALPRYAREFTVFARATLNFEQLKRRIS